MAGNNKSVLVDTFGNNMDMPEASEIERIGDRANTLVDAVSVSQILSSMDMPARSRWQIYDRYQYMIGDPIINAALNLHVTQALGGHETSGDVVFLDKKPDISPAEEDLVDDIQNNLMPLLNRIAYPVCFNGAGYGDAYGRIYTDQKLGVINIDAGDFYLPPLVQPFEKGGRTVGFQVSVENKTLVSLTAMQMARMKMPRMSFLPQTRVQYNHWLQMVEEDDLNLVKPLPSTVGGSFCEAAEKPFFLLQAALTGLSSSRILDSMRETMLGLNMTDMSKDQQDKFFNRIAMMLKESKKRATDAINKNKPVVENIFHLIPTWQEKQLYSIDAGGSKNAQTNSYNVDDVMFYAKMLAGALGLDLSLLGFSELLSGGLGDGGFFRISAQAGMRNRMIRQAYTGFCNHVIDVHCQTKYKGVFAEGKRPYDVLFIGATGALEREQQETRERKVMAASTVMQVIQQLKENGATIEIAEHFLKEQMGFDEDDAKIYAQMVGASDNLADEEM